MAIQISEDKLSENARSYLKKAKSKSQFLRDALEYYTKALMNVGNENSENNANYIDEEVAKDIKEIKEIVLKLSLTNNKPYEIVKHENTDNKEKNIDVVNDKEIKPKNSIITNKVENKNYIEENIIEAKSEKIESIKDAEDKLSDDEREKLERDLDYSIGNF